MAKLGLISQRNNNIALLGANQIGDKMARENRQKVDKTYDCDLWNEAMTHDHFQVFKEKTDVE